MFTQKVTMTLAPTGVAASDGRGFTPEVVIRMDRTRVIPILYEGEYVGQVTRVSTSRGAVCAVGWMKGHDHPAYYAVRLNTVFPSVSLNKMQLSVAGFKGFVKFGTLHSVHLMTTDVRIWSCQHVRLIEPGDAWRPEKPHRKD